ncbi:hypothetical protein BH11PSE11_BH11PSE11_32150 [soil metagenome]
MRALVLLSICMLSPLLSGCGGSSDAVSKSVFAVIGDSPYGTSPTDTTQTLANPAFINVLNSDADVSLVLHTGDIHSGKQYCTQDYNQTILNQWKAFKNPLIYTPGDNEWTDCHKPAEGGGTYNATTGVIDYVKDASGNQVDYKGGEPVENLKLVRSLFFATPGKSQGAAMDVNSQAILFDPANPADKEYVENVWFEKSRVLVVTVNIPGGSNNDTDIWYGAPTMSQSQSQEVATRSAAALRWIDAAFKRATDNGDIAVLIMLQADMWDADGKPASHIVQYKQFIDRIASNTKTFGKPVLLLNGDSHIYRSDNPLKQGSSCAIETTPGTQTIACPTDAYVNQPNGYDVPNFHRIVVHGSTAPLEWLKLTIDPAANAANGANAFGPFSWTRMQTAL